MISDEKLAVVLLCVLVNVVSVSLTAAVTLNAPNCCGALGF